MAVKPMADLAYLRGRCLCTDRRDCWHGPCRVRRQLRSGSVLLENGSGYVRLARTGEVTLRGVACQQTDGSTGSECVSQKEPKGDRQISQIEPTGGE